MQTHTESGVSGCVNLYSTVSEQGFPATSEHPVCSVCNVHNVTQG